MEAAEQQVCTSRRRQRTKFFEETESKTKPRKARDTPKKDPQKRKTESNSTPPRKKPKVSPPLSTHDKPEKQPVLAQCLPELKATPMTSIFSTKNSCEPNLSSQLDATYICVFAWVRVGCKDCSNRFLMTSCMRMKRISVCINCSPNREQRSCKTS
jgi:hypothetical protein